MITWQRDEYLQMGKKSIVNIRSTCYDKQIITNINYMIGALLASGPKTFPKIV